MSSDWLITLITQRTSACNTSSDMIKDVLGVDTGTVDTSLVGSEIATEDETCASDLFVVGADLFVLPKKSVIDCVKGLCLCFVI